MRIAIDTERRAVVTWQGGEIAALSMTRGDRFPLEVRFISEGKFSSLPEGASGKLMLKRAGAYAADPLAAALGWVKSGTAANTIYTFSLNLNTVQLNTALTGDTLDVALEVEWSHGNTIQSSLPVSVVVARDYIQDSEGIPEEAIDLRATEADAIAGTNNEKWVSPLRAWDAIRAWANANFNWTNLADKPSTFAPAAHKSSHATGGTDPITPAQIGAVRGFEISGNPPDTNIAPAAMELRDNEDSGGVALKCDGRLDNQWSVLFPTSFRTAIGAAPASDSNPEVANSALGLYDTPNGWYALKIDDSRVFLAGEEFDLGTVPDAPTALKKNFRAAINTVRRVPDGHAPDAAEGYIDQAAQLWDAVSGDVALSIADGAVSFGPYAEELNVAANFRAAINTVRRRFVSDGEGEPDGAQGFVDQAAQLWDTVNGEVALSIADGAVSFGPYAEALNVAANFREAIGLGNAQLALSAKSPLSVFIRLSGCPDENFNTLYTYAGIFEGNPKYYAATGESISYNSEEWVVETAEGVTQYLNSRSDLDPSYLTSGWRRMVGASSLPVSSVSVERVSPVPNKNTIADPVVQAATELRTQEANNITALIYSAEDDSWRVHDAANFREAIGAATSAQGAKADTSLQQGAYISAASLEVGTIAAGQTADLYVGQDGKVGIGTETPTEKLTVAGNIDLLEGQVKNLGAPVADTDAATKGYVDGLIPQAPPTGTYTLRSVDGVVSWVAA